MKRSIFMIAVALVALTACGGNRNSTSSNLSTNSSSTPVTSTGTSNTSTNVSTSSPNIGVVTNISQNALDSISSSMKLTGSYKIDAVKYGSDYDQVYESIQIYAEDQYYNAMFIGKNKIVELNLYNDNDFASSKILTEMNVVEEKLLKDENGDYYYWDDYFANNLSLLKTTDFELQEDGTFLCVNPESATEVAFALYGEKEEMQKVTLTVEEDKVTKIDFVSAKYTYDGVVYRDSGSFTVSEHGTAIVPELTARESKPEHEILAAALAEINVNYTANVYAEITPYGYDTSTGEYAYYFADDHIYCDNGDESQSYGYYFDAGTLYTFGVNEGKTYFDSLLEGVTGDVSIIGFDFSTFAPEMFTYDADKDEYVIEDEFASTIGYLISIDQYAEYSTKVAIKLNDENKLESIQYDFFVDGIDGGYGFYKYTFANIGTTVAPVSLEGLFADISVIRNIPAEIIGKWTTTINDSEVTVRISKTAVYFGTTKATLVSCDGETLVVNLNDETYEFSLADTVGVRELVINYADSNYTATRADDSKWNYEQITQYVGNNIVPAFTGGEEYYFGKDVAGDGSEMFVIEVYGDASRTWEEEYIIDLTAAGFIQDTSYEYDDGYGYIFVAPDSSCFVQFFYNADYDVFLIYIYNM